MIKLVNLLYDDATGDCSVDAPAAEKLVGSGAEVDDGARCVLGCEVGLFEYLVWSALHCISPALRLEGLYTWMW
jgi:hypothetical protein